ncbi:MAG: adenylylsulfate kinase [Bacteroidales bacterium]|nr:adenylylsulfate kinase [Bacteroidales bacterium]MDN5329561.1 adenylylsulfate kinase [Bacteroidales bacterium]
MENFIYPVKILSREEREAKLGQRSKVIWFTGLSGAGKSTLGSMLELVLFEKGFVVQLFDGDNIRAGINNDLGFSIDDRRENLRRVAEINRLFLFSGIITINCFIAPTEELRRMIAGIIGSDDLIEVFADCPLEICEQRDTKGLYKMAREGKISHFTGISSPFEPPANPQIHLRTDLLTPEQCLKEILDVVLPQISHN